MKFRRNVHLYRGSLDAAPLATVLFLLVIFLALASRIYTPGVHIELPSASNLSGTDKPAVTVAMDANGRMFYQNQPIEPGELKLRLAAAVTNSSEPLVLIIKADQAVTEENMEILRTLAGEAGIREAWAARLPRAIDAPARGVKSTGP